MRVNQSQTQTDERGIALIFVAICLVVLCGSAAIAIDLGNGWVTRRNLVTATDAAALAAAQEFALGGDGCAATDDQYVLANNPSAINIDCTVTGSPAGGTVTVYAEDNVNTWFAAVIGQGDYLASSATTVRWGGAQGMEGLRPIGLCAKSNGLGQWVANPVEPLEVKVMFSNPDGQPDLCSQGTKNGNNVPGNWGLIDFDTPRGNDSKDWVANGYPGTVYAGTPGRTCLQEPEYCYPPQTGELTQVRRELEGLIGRDIVVPIIDYSVDRGGNTTAFHVIGFANVVILDVGLTGADKDRYITIRFESVLADGDCCSVGGGPSNVSVIQPCAVDNRNLAACAS
jgi:hypothetical protein